MDREAVLAALRAHRAELEAAGVAHAGVFGSVARGEAGPGSDIDVLIECVPGRPRSVWDYAGLKNRVGDLLPGRVDVIDVAGLRPTVRESALRDLVPAF